MIALDAPRKRRRPSLTPMIDVVFLLLVFFMLAARFGVERAQPLPMAGGGGGYSGPPRVVDVAQTSVALNGVALPEAGLAAAIAPLMTDQTDVIVLRSRDGATVQRLIDVADDLAAAGYETFVVAE